MYIVPGLQVAHVLHTQWVQFCLITMRVATVCTLVLLHYVTVVCVHVCDQG